MMYKEGYTLTAILEQTRDLLKSGLSPEQIRIESKLTLRIIKELSHDLHTPAICTSNTAIEQMALEGHLPRVIGERFNLTPTEVDNLTAGQRVSYRATQRDSEDKLVEAMRLLDCGYGLVEVMVQTSCDELYIKPIFYSQYCNRHRRSEMVT